MPRVAARDTIMKSMMFNVIFLLSEGGPLSSAFHLGIKIESLGVIITIAVTAVKES